MSSLTPAPTIAVPLLVLDDLDATEIARTLGDEFRVISVHSVPDFEPMIEENGFGSVFASDAHSTLLRELRRICGRCPVAYLVLVLGCPTTGGDPESLPSDVALLSRHGGMLQLRRGVRHGWFEGRCRLLAASLRAAGLPKILTGALRNLLRQRIPKRLADPGPLRTTEDLADAIGATRPYLSATATANGVPLGSLAAWWTAILAWECYVTSDLTWEQIAWRCGYKGVPGLSNLFRRHFGHRLRSALREVDLAVEMDRFGSVMGGDAVS